jgi:heme/copper-type cytochrome/quinol oxidase subunit 1
VAVSQPIVAPRTVAPRTGAPERLAQSWRQPPGFWGWFQNVHHTAIGTRFMVTAFIFFLLGGVLASMMRIQLAHPASGVMGPDFYNQVFTMHGSTMIFLFAVPMMFQGFGVYVVPLMCGTRNIAFPRLNAFCYYIYLGGALLLWFGFLTNTGADTGWFSYVTLAGPMFSPGKRVDFWAQMITFTEVSALGVAICIATTNTANAFSTSNFALSSGNVYSAAQPGGHSTASSPQPIPLPRSPAIHNSLVKRMIPWWANRSAA